MECYKTRKEKKFDLQELTYCQQDVKHLSGYKNETLVRMTIFLAIRKMVMKMCEWTADGK